MTQMTGSNVLDNLEDLSIEQLKKIQYEVDSAIAKRRREDALIEIKRIAKEAGVDLLELVEEVVSQPLAAVRVFVDPRNAKNVWNGKGRHPKWFSDLVKSGTDPETLIRR